MAKSRTLRKNRARAPKGGVEVHGKRYQAGQLLPTTVAGVSAAIKSNGRPKPVPNTGQFAVPHVISFTGISTGASNVYRSPDEAILHSLQNARAMRNDAGVMECLEQRQRATALLNWHIEVEDEHLPEHKLLSERLTKIVQHTPRFVEYRRSLLEALWYGKQGVQHKFGFEPKLNGDLIIKRWLPINGDKIVFRADSDQMGIRVTAGRPGNLISGGKWRLEHIKENVLPTHQGLAFFLDPAERRTIAVHKHMIEDAPFESPLHAGAIHGIGIRSRIYWTWFQMQETLAFLMEYMERSALGIELWFYPAGNPQGEEDARKAAEERVGGGRNIIMVPRLPDANGNDSYGVERIDPSAAGADILQQVVTDFFGHKIKRYILGQVLTSEAQATGLGSEVAVLHQNTFLVIVKYDATNLEESISTDMLEPLKLWNAPEAKNVHCRFKIDTEEQDAESKLAAVEKAYQMGAAIKASDVYDMVGLSKPEDGDETLSIQDQQPQGMFPGFGPGIPQATEGGGFPGVSAAPTGTSAGDPQIPVDGRRFRKDRYADFREEDHPRDEGGKFTDSGGSTVIRGRSFPGIDLKESDSGVSGSGELDEITPIGFYSVSKVNSISPGEFDGEHEAEAARAAVKAAREFWSDDGRDARSIRRTDGVGSDAAGNASSQRVNLNIVMTADKSNAGAGSGGPGSAKVFWAPYSLDGREEKLGDVFANSLGVDPIYVLSHEMHHAFGFGSELDHASDVAAVSAHLATDMKFSRKVSERYVYTQVSSMNWSSGPMKNAAGRRLRYLHNKHPEALLSAAVSSGIVDNEDQWNQIVDRFMKIDKRKKGDARSGSGS